MENLTDEQNEPDGVGQPRPPRKQDSPLRVWDIAPFSLPCMVEAALLVVVVCFILGLLLKAIWPG